MVTKESKYSFRPSTAQGGTIKTSKANEVIKKVTVNFEEVDPLDNKSKTKSPAIMSYATNNAATDQSSKAKAAPAYIRLSSR